MPELCLTIPQGKLQGYVCTTDNGFKYNCYMGIPYAKPPIGKLRFKDPQPPESWDGIRDATVEGNTAPQINKLFTQNYSGNEDCLIVNVYVPELAKDDEKLPVMVYFHGGAFIMGSGEKDMFGPDYLVEKNVIVVTVNYRLGILGFLCLHTPEVPGNAGLKDQVFALRWVQENISRFGGNADNVTIFGESAGAGSVHYLMMSPMAKGLFHRGIMQSGSCTNNWARQMRPEETAFGVAELLGVKSKNKEDILNELREIPAEDMVKAIYTDMMTGMIYNFIPVIEKNYPEVDAFITESPMEIMSSGNYNKVPCITGFNSLEGILFVAEQFMGKADVSKLQKFEDLGMSLELLLPDNIKSLDIEKKNNIINKIKEFYFPAERKFADCYIDYMSDITFVLQIDATAKLMCSNSHPVYYYRFSYNGSKNLYKPMVNYPYSGASHGDDLSFLFNINVEKLFESKQKMEPPSKGDLIADNITTQRLSEMWTNFAKSGNPTPTLNDVITENWSPLTQNKINCLEISDKMGMITDPFADRIAFWNNIVI